MADNYTINQEGSMLNITCPIECITQLKRELNNILAEEVVRNFKEGSESGYQFGLMTEIAKKYNCTSNNIKAMLTRRGFKFKLNVAQS